MAHNQSPELCENEKDFQFPLQMMKWMEWYMYNARKTWSCVAPPNQHLSPLPFSVKRQ